MGIYDKKYDLMVFGEPMVQYTTKNNDITTAKLQNPSVGGEDIFVAATAAIHGFSSGFYSVIAKDPYENMIKNTLRKHNISTDFCISANGFNGIEIVSDNNNETREFFYNRPPGFFNSPIPPNLDTKLLDQCRMIYASSAFTLSSPEARSLVFESFYYAHNNGIFVAFDPNLRLHRHNSTYLRETLWMLMPFIDFFSVSAASGEMQFMFARDDLPENMPIEEKNDLTYDDMLFYRERNMKNCAMDLVKRNVQYATIRNGGEKVYFAYSDEKNKVQEGFIPVQKLENGFFSYSGAVFNGAFISAILKEYSPGEAASYAANCATKKCLLGNTLASIFSTDA